MSLTETLERLSVVSPKFIRRCIITKQLLIGDLRFLNSEFDQPEVDRRKWEIFGAICEKCESIPGHEIELRDLGPFWKVTIWVMVDGEKKPLYNKLSFKDKGGHPAHAAAQSLLAACEAPLEERDAEWVAVIDKMIKADKIERGKAGNSDWDKYVLHNARVNVLEELKTRMTQ